MAPIRPEDHAFVFQASVLAELRRNLSLNQAELAELLDVPINTLSRWERGSNVPDANALAALFSIASEHGVTPEFFKQRKGTIVHREVRESLVIQWDYQNLGISAGDCEDFIPELLGYIRLIFPNLGSVVGMAYGTVPDRNVQAQLRTMQFEFKNTIFDADRQLIQDGEDLFRMRQIVNSGSIDPTIAVYVLVSNDGDYADFLGRIKEVGAEVFVCGYADCSQKLVRAVGSDHFIPWQRPYMVAKCYEVASGLVEKAISKSAFGNQCKVALEEDGFEGDDYEELLEEAGFSVNRPFTSVMQHMNTFGILRVTSPEGDPNRVKFSVPTR